MKSYRPAINGFGKGVSQDDWDGKLPKSDENFWFDAYFPTAKYSIALSRQPAPWEGRQQISSKRVAMVLWKVPIKVVGNICR
jgi:hypothetical protein